MKFLSVLGWIIQLCFALMDRWLERDRELKRSKEEVLSEVREGIKKRDASMVNAAFDKLRRI